ncbi:MAG: hypothetical protein K2Q14_00460 [Gammaproteobacteria bacterium]|nr:hypothetical protein [Gammaproteobacteria bacterium]
MAKVKAFLKFNNEQNQSDFSHTKCLLSISIGQQSHEGEMFESTIELVNQNFGSCAISLYDSLQRYTMALQSSKSPEFFHAVATKEGDLWIKRNKKYLDQLNKLEVICRWDMWLQHPTFTRYRKELKDLINTDDEYKAVFDQTVEKYLDKYCSQLMKTPAFDKTRVKNLCLEYVVEECAVLRLWPELQCQYEAYPGIHNAAMEETRRRFVTIEHFDLLQPLTIKFRNAPQLRPQRFELFEAV